MNIRGLRAGFSALLVATATAVAQGTIERIMLPDSAGVASPGEGSFYWPDLNRTYFGGDAGIGVMEGLHGRLVRRIDENGMLNVSDRTLGDTASRRLVHACGYDTLTYIIDPDADTVVAAVRIPNYAVGRTTSARDACVDVRNHHLFVCYQMTAGGPDGIAAYDLVTGALLDTMHAPLGRLCSNPTSDKLYVLTYGVNEVHIYDAATRTFIKTLPVGSGPSSIAWLARCNKVYVTNLFGASVTIIDGAGDSVICDLGTPVGPDAPTMNEREGNVMVTTDDGFIVIDGAGDSVRALIPASHGSATGWSSVTDRYYCSYRGGFKVVDGLTDSLLADRPSPVWASGVTCNTQQNITYLYSAQTWQMHAIDGNTDTTLWLECTGRLPWYESAAWSQRRNRYYLLNMYGRDALEAGLTSAPARFAPLPQGQTGGMYLPPVFDSDEEKLYAPELYLDTMTVVACSSMSVVARFALPGPAAAPAVAMPDINRVYLPTSSASGLPPDPICVFDTRIDSLVRYDFMPDSTSAAEGASAVSPVSHKAYWSAGFDRLIVLDAVLDTATCVRVASDAVVGGLLWYPPTDRLYISTGENLKVMDCATDSVIATAPVSLMHGMCYCTELDKVYGITEDGSGMRAVACSTNRVVLRLGLGFSRELPPVYCPSTNRVYAVVHTGYADPVGYHWWIVAVDCATDEVAEWFDIQYEPFTLTAVPDSNIVIAACRNSALYVIRDQAPGLSDRGSTSVTKGLSLSVRPVPAARNVLISANITGTGPVTLGIYDAAGRKVASLIDEPSAPGRLQTMWDGTDGMRPVSAGTYFARLRTSDGQAVARVVLAR